MIGKPFQSAADSRIGTRRATDSNSPRVLAMEIAGQTNRMARVGDAPTTVLPASLIRIEVPDAQRHNAQILAALQSDKLDRGNRPWQIRESIGDSGALARLTP